MLSISKKVNQISESQTVALTRLAAKLVRSGKDVLTLGVGEPDFDTPEHIGRAAVEAIGKGYTKYTATDGLYDLRKSISLWLNKEYNASFEANEIIVSNGAKQAVAQAIFAVCDPGDEVLIPKPYWVSYPAQVMLSGATPVFMETDEENEFKISAAELENSITDKTKLLLLNSPSNPSGAVYSREELDGIVSVVLKRGIYLLADEVYDQIVFDQNKFASLSSFGNVKENLLYVNGVSKSFAMTGWRIGFLASNESVANAVRKFQGHTTSNASTISQYAAIAAYSGEKQFIKEMTETFHDRRDYVLRRLRSMRNVTCAVPAGAFYAFPNISAYYSKVEGISTSVELCRYLLQNFNVAIVPGLAFGMDDHVRISYATDKDTLVEALNRIEAGLDSILKRSK